MRAAKALASLRMCRDSHTPSFLASVMLTKIVYCPKDTAIAHHGHNTKTTVETLKINCMDLTTLTLD